MPVKLRPKRAETDTPIIQMIGKGIYTPSEVSRYSGIPLSTVRSWMFGSPTREQLFHRELPTVDQYVTFLDFIQAVGVRAFRTKESRVPMHKLRFAIEYARDKYAIAYPLASSRSRILLMDSDLAIELDDGKYVDASKRHRGCFLIPKIVEELWEKIIYSPATGMAEEYMPRMAGRFRVALNPHILFGAPYLPSCGYTAETLAQAVVTEGGVHAAAEAYGVKVAEIKAAQQFISSLQKSAA